MWTWLECAAEVLLEMCMTPRATLRVLLVIAAIFVVAIVVYRFW